MPIERQSGLAKGSDFQALADYVRTLTETSRPARIVLQSMCSCRGTLFRLESDPEEGCARRTCPACGAAAFLADSEATWDGADPEAWACSCGHEQCEIGVGFAFGADDQISWVTIGQRCPACGVLGSAADWKIDDSPGDHLFEKT